MFLILCYSRILSGDESNWIINQNYFFHDTKRVNYVNLAFTVFCLAEEERFPSANTLVN